MRKFNFIRLLVLASAIILLHACTDDDFPKKSDVPKTTNTATDWVRTVKIVEYDRDDISPFRITLTTYDQYGRKTGSKTTTASGSVLHEESEYIYKGTTAQYNYIFTDSYGIQQDGTDRFKHRVTFRDNWTDIVQETVWKKSRESSRREWDYDDKGRIVEYRYYDEGSLYSGNIDYRYDGNNKTYYRVSYKSNSKIKVEEKEEPTPEGHLVKQVHYQTNGIDIAYWLETYYDGENRHIGTKSYSADGELLFEEKDFEYNGKQLTYYRYNYRAEVSSPETGNNTTRSGPEDTRYKTKIMKLFY